MSAKRNRIVPAHSGELALIDWIRRQTSGDTHVLLGIGDDTASLRWPDSDCECLITTDMLLEGSCFLLEEAGARRVGRKAMAVNLSDVAAMAGEPLAAVVSVGLPRHKGRELAQELFLGMQEIAREHNVAIVGGDTSTWDGPLVINVALVAQSTGKGSVRRSGAKPGDWLLVTGPLGGSILGKHLDFQPRVREAQQLHQIVDLHAMIDVSDGLALDVARLCDESECGAVLRAEKVPISESAARLHDQKPPLQHALSDGEDFELVFAVTPAHGEWLLSEQPVEKIHLACIGECVSDAFWLEVAGKRNVLSPDGYVHSLE